MSAEVQVNTAQSPSQAPANTPSQPSSQPSSQPLTNMPNQTPNQDDSRSVMTYIFIGVLTLALVLLIYFSYEKFVANSAGEEKMTKGVEQERDDPVVDFNLREAIRDLQNIQKDVLSTLSENANF